MLLLSSPAADASSFEVRVSALANLVYQLDCLSGARRCTGTAFRDLWRRIAAPADSDEHLGRWREIHERYRIFADFRHEAPASAYPYTFPFLQARGVDVAEKIRLASLQAADFDDYGSRLRLLMQPADARESMAILTAFRPAFEPWWEDVAAPDLRRLALGYEYAAATADLPELLDQVAGIFAVDQRNISAMTVSLIALPEGANGSQATVLENHAIVESRRGEAPRDRLGVIVHEFVHYLYSLSPPPRHRALLAAFLASGEPFAMRGYNLINEAVASAIGNGILERRLLSAEDYGRYESLPDSFYADYYVDTVAKALVPLIDGYLTRGEALGPAFAGEFLATVGSALGTRRDDLALQLLSSAVVATDSRLKALTLRPAATLTTFSVFSHVTGTPSLEGTALGRYPELSGIVLILADDLPAAEALLAEGERELLVAVSERRDAFVYGIERSPYAQLYLAVGRDVAAVGRALDHLLSRGRVFTGLSLPSTAGGEPQDVPVSALSSRISKRIPMPRSRSSKASPMASAGVRMP